MREMTRRWQVQGCLGACARGVHISRLRLQASLFSFRDASVHTSRLRLQASLCRLPLAEGTVEQAASK